MDEELPMPCAGCGLPRGEKYPSEPSVRRRTDGITRCNDCERAAADRRKAKCAQCGFEDAPIEAVTNRFTDTICIKCGGRYFVPIVPPEPPMWPPNAIERQRREAIHRLYFGQRFSQDDAVLFVDNIIALGTAIA